jgi:hypothetical protein
MVVFDAPTIDDNVLDDLTTYTCDHISGTAFALGDTTVTCTAADETGNTASCSFIVSIADIEPPTQTCPSNVAISTNANQPFGTPAFQVTADDNVGASTQCFLSDGVTPVASGNAFPIGETSVRCETADAANNKAPDCTFTVTVTDQEPPSFTACNTGLELGTQPGVATAVATWTTAAVDNSLTTVDIACSLPSGTVFSLGTTAVTCTATDESSNTKDCVFNVTVEDDEKPTVSCPGTKTVETSPGEATGVATFTAPVLDNVDNGLIATCTPSSGFVFPLLETQVTCQAQDAAGNEGTCTFDVVVEDKEAPQLQGCDRLATSHDTDFYESFATITFPTVTAVDNTRATVPVFCNFQGQLQIQVGNYDFECNATDDHGNDNVCATAFTVVDSHQPRLECSTELSEAYTFETGQSPTANLTYTEPIATDNVVAQPSVSCEPAPNTLLAPGLFNITCMTSDGTNAAQTCVIPAEVVNTNNPSFIAGCSNRTGGTSTYLPADMSLPQALDGQRTAASVQCVPALSSPFGLGTTSVVCTATDQNSVLTVTIVDDVNPSLDCPASSSINAGDGLSTAVLSYTVDATDDVSQALQPTCSQANGAILPIGMTRISCSVSDGFSNKAECAFNITVLDVELPVLTCPDTITNTIIEENITLTFEVAVTDNSGEDLFASCTPVSGDAFNRDSIVQVLCDSADASNNLGQCSFSVVTNDARRPVIQCPVDQNLTLSQDTNTATVTFTSASASDITGEALNASCSAVSGTEFSVGQTSVTCTVESPSSGLEGSCSFLITVKDEQLPVITCPDNLFVLGQLGQTNQEVSWSVVATDNSNTAPTTCTPASGSALQAGESTMVSCTATDPSGNSDSCTFDITIDTEPPVVDGCFDRVGYTSNGLRVDDATLPASSDLTSVTTLCTPALDSIFGYGTSTVDCTFTDQVGLESNCSFSVTIFDDVPPIIVCPTPQPIDTEAAANYGLVVYTAPTATDDMTLPAAVSVSCDMALGAQIAVGMDDVTCVAKDEAENSASCMFNLTVKDVEPPLVQCSEDIVIRTEQLRVVVNYATNATDNVDGMIDALCSSPSGSEYEIRSRSTVVCSATDAASNTGQCAFTIIIQDSAAPNVTCPPSTTVGTTNGSATASLSYAPPVAMTGDQALTATCDLANGAELPLGASTVTCTATDENENEGLCSFVVTVQDREAPQVTCPANIQVPQETGTAYAVVNWITAVTDNVDASLEVSCTPLANSSFALGSHTVACVATDAASNVDQCSFEVVVLDTELPGIQCSNLSLTLPMGKAEMPINLASAIVSFSDNSGTARFVSCEGSEQLGPSISAATCTVRDSTELSATCSFVVEVKDAEKPVITCPAMVTLFTTKGEDSATATYALPMASDNVDLAPQVFCNLAQSTTINIGETIVNCTATDSASNTDTCVFVIKVLDQEAPVLSCPPSIIVRTNESISFIDYPLNGTDNSLRPVSIVCDTPSGSEFVLGSDTSVSCDVFDASRNQGQSCTFVVSIVDERAPIVSCPDDMSFELAPDAATMTVDYAVSAVDNTGAAITVVCDAPVDNAFPVGQTVTTCSASDTLERVGKCAFTVQVSDVTAPTFTECPAKDIVHVVTNSSDRLNVTWDAVAAVDNANQFQSVQCTHEPDTTFGFGTTAVTCTAIDAFDNQAQCLFNVIVQLPPPEDCEFSYGPWSTCQLCPRGDALQESRVITISAPKYGGKACPNTRSRACSPCQSTEGLLKLSPVNQAAVDASRQSIQEGIEATLTEMIDLVEAVEVTSMSFETLPEAGQARRQDDVTLVIAFLLHGSETDFASAANRELEVLFKLRFDNFTTLLTGGQADCALCQVDSARYSQPQASGEAKKRQPLAVLIGVVGAVVLMVIVAATLSTRSRNNIPNRVKPVTGKNRLENRRSSTMGGLYDSQTSGSQVDQDEEQLDLALFSNPTYDPSHTFIAEAGEYDNLPTVQDADEDAAGGYLDVEETGVDNNNFDVSVDASFSRLMGDFHRADTMIHQRKLERVEAQNKAMQDQLNQLSTLMRGSGGNSVKAQEPEEDAVEVDEVDEVDEPGFMDEDFGEESLNFDEAASDEAAASVTAANDDANEDDTGYDVESGDEAGGYSDDSDE